MLFSSSRCPLPALTAWCRILRHGLSAGLDVVQVFGQLARSGPAVLRPVAAAVAARLQQGEAVADALAAHADRFPPLFLELVRIGEQTGQLDETLRVLEEYYEQLLSLQRTLRSQLIYPAMMYLAAVGVIALLIVILGFLGGMGKAVTTDPLGLGLQGLSGAIVFVLVALGVPAALLAVLKGLSERVQWRRQLEAALLWLPGWGPALHTLALHRCAVALRMGQEAGLSVLKTLRYALEATSNAAFTAGQAAAERVVKKGGTLAEALAASKAPFPEEFRQMVILGEETGNLPEVMARAGQRYAEDAARQLKNAVHLTAWAVYIGIAIVIIIAIFRLASIYLGAIQQAVG